MSFGYGGTSADIETGFPGFMHNHRAARVDAAQSNSNTLFFIVTVLLLFMILNLNQMPNFLIWLVFGVFLMATIYQSCLQLQPEVLAQAAAASALLGYTDMPPTISHAAIRRLQGFRFHLALLDREFGHWDYETSIASDIDNVRAAPSMSEEEINALPVHRYKLKGTHHVGSPMQHASCPASTDRMEGASNVVGGTKASEDDLTCNVCLDQVNVGELVRSLPCLHQFHAKCIDPWLRLQGTCPVCKFRTTSGWHQNGEDGLDASDMV